MKEVNAKQDNEDKNNSSMLILKRLERRNLIEAIQMTEVAAIRPEFRGKQDVLATLISENIKSMLTQDFTLLTPLQQFASALITARACSDANAYEPADFFYQEAVAVMNRYQITPGAIAGFMMEEWRAIRPLVAKEDSLVKFNKRDVNKHAEQYLDSIKAQFMKMLGDHLPASLLKNLDHINLNLLEALLLVFIQNIQKIEQQEFQMASANLNCLKNGIESLIGEDHLISQIVTFFSAVANFCLEGKLKVTKAALKSEAIFVDAFGSESRIALLARTFAAVMRVQASRNEDTLLALKKIINIGIERKLKHPLIALGLIQLAYNEIKTLNFENGIPSYLLLLEQGLTTRDTTDFFSSFNSVVQNIMQGWVDQNIEKRISSFSKAYDLADINEDQFELKPVVLWQLSINYQMMNKSLEQYGALLQFSIYNPHSDDIEENVIDDMKKAFLELGRQLNIFRGDRVKFRDYPEICIKLAHKFIEMNDSQLALYYSYLSESVVNLAQSTFPAQSSIVYQHMLRFYYLCNEANSLPMIFNRAYKNAVIYYEYGMLLYLQGCYNDAREQLKAAERLVSEDTQISYVGKEKILVKEVVDEDQFANNEELTFQLKNLVSFFLIRCEQLLAARNNDADNELLQANKLEDSIVEAMRTSILDGSLPMSTPRCKF